MVNAHTGKVGNASRKLLDSRLLNLFLTILVAYLLVLVLVRMFESRLGFSCRFPAAVSTRVEVLISVGAKEVVGANGFEPSTSWSRTRRSSQAEPRPDRHAQTLSTVPSRVHRLA
jgi:hypothetical protein